jgi:2-(1,2-epoxy-1,2-dihydrophenyl)acetyl-CoA isomerase
MSPASDAAPRVRTEVDGDLWRVTLARPDAGNVIDVPMADALAAAFAGSDEPGAFVGRLAGTWHEVVRLLTACRVPVVAGVQGAIAGAAVGLLGVCDVVVCARSAVVRPAYAAIGFYPDGGTSWVLTRALGAARALDLMLTAGGLTAEEARDAGLVARVVADDELTDAATALARGLAAGPVRAMVRTRQLVRLAAGRTLDDHLDDEARLIALSAADPEGREGVAAFVGKRVPDFRTAR